MNKLALLTVLILTGCASAPPKYGHQEADDLKKCLQAKVILQASADCTRLTPNICIFTMSDLLLVQEAGADAQNYCPVLRPGEDGANN